MGKLLSLQKVVTAIIMLFLGGLTVIIPMHYTSWLNPITLTLWSIAFVLLIAMLIYQTQRIDIDIWKCDIEDWDRNGNFYLVVNGDVKARHSDSAREFRLSLLDRSFAPESTKINKIDDKPQNFILRFQIANCFLEDGREMQNSANPLDIAQICVATTQNKYWASAYFTFPYISTYQENWKEKIRRKLFGNTKKVKGYGISKFEFQKILTLQNVKQQIVK